MKYVNGGIRMADYPDWVLTHKTKGTYINKVGDKYYLYAGHSQRVPGTKKVKRICDGYLGRITQDQGLIPPKDKISGPVHSYEFGLSSLVLSLCANIHKGLRRTFVVNGDLVMCASVLTFLYGFFSQDLFLHSWLSLHFPDLSIPEDISAQQKNGIQRGFLMISDTMNRLFGSELPLVKASFSQVTLICANHRLYCCEIPDSVSSLILKYSLEWRPDLWQK